MTRQNEPLTEMEKRVFGVDAVRLADGSIQERGFGSAFNEARIADAARIEAARRGSPAAAPPQPTPPAPERAIDSRVVHPYPDRVQ
jgi:hypothetical protein